MDPPEAELRAHMTAYRDGEIDAFDALYAAFAGPLRGYLLSQCRDGAACFRVSAIAAIPALIAAAILAARASPLLPALAGALCGLAAG